MRERENKCWDKRRNDKISPYMLTLLIKQWNDKILNGELIVQTNENQWEKILKSINKYDNIIIIDD